MASVLTVGPQRRQLPLQGAPVTQFDHRAQFLPGASGSVHQRLKIGLLRSHLGLHEADDVLFVRTEQHGFRHAPHRHEPMVAADKTPLLVGHQDAVSRRLQGGPQHSAGPGQLHLGVDPCAHHSWIDGLDDEVHRPQSQALGFVFSRVLGCDKDDGNRGGLGVSLQLPQHFVAIQPRHDQVEQNDIGGVLPAQRQGPLTSGGHQHLVVLRENLVERLDVDGLVVHHQQADLLGSQGAGKDALPADQVWRGIHEFNAFIRSATSTAARSNSSRSTAVWSAGNRVCADNSASDRSRSKASSAFMSDA